MARTGSINTAMLGAAGEHYVMCQLLRRGMIAAIAPAGAPDVDIIVSDREGHSLAAVQVKARQNTNGKSGWPLNRKHEGIIRSSLFYAFVDFGKTLTDPPRCWIVPSSVVAEAITDSHKSWLSMPGHSGRVHQDNDMRSFLHDYSHQGLDRPAGWLSQFLERWDTILAGA
ncbi:hypothetical protein FE263_17355 [Lichenicoccus roseus]|uniref:Aspartate ammonia-lyase n=1 Tax=Lichenicoccus roseus TaxID=2683649 RepID=A0A5R9J6M1_9PROT|nr:hypothetical protein FE263_17355 [Lichenicoccus roseus]